MSKVIASQYEGVCPNCPDGIYPDEAILKGPFGWEHAICDNPHPNPTPRYECSTCRSTVTVQELIGLLENLPEPRDMKVQKWEPEGLNPVISNGRILACPNVEWGRCSNTIVEI